MSKAIIFLLIAYCNLTFSARAQLISGGDSLMALGQYDKAIEVYNQTINDTIGKARLTVGNAHMRKGNCLNKLGNPKDAIANYFIALKIFDQLKSAERIATVYLNIANAYDKQNETRSSEKYYRQALDISLSINDTAKIAAILNELGIVEYKNGHSREAIRWHKLALDNYRNGMHDATLCKHYINIGNSYENISSDSSMYFYLQGKAIAEAIRDSVSLAKIYLNIGDLYRDAGNFSLALKYLNNSLYLNTDFGDSIDLAVIHHNLAQVFDSLQDYKKAYDHEKIESLINASLYNSDKLQYTTELAAKYESEKKDETIRTKVKENELKSRNLLLSLLGLVLAAALTVIAFTSYYRKQNANVKLQEQNLRIEKLNQQLDASNQVKSKLFSVISHDLRGPVSSIYSFLQLQQLQLQKSAANVAPELAKSFSKQTEQLLETLEDLLIWSKSQLHEFVPILEIVNVTDLVNQIKDFLIRDIEARSLSFTQQIAADCKVHTDLNMLTIILRNLLANAVKYAEPGSTILISAINSDTALEFTLQNNSKSTASIVLEDDHSPVINSNARGLGVTLIREFAQKLNGSIQYRIEGNTITSILSIAAPKPALTVRS